MTFRKVLFWLHLIAGLITGLVIGIMSFTGATLAFEKDLVAFAERHVRRVAVPPDSPPLALEELQSAFAKAYPEKHATGIQVANDPAAAVTFQVGRNEAYYVNPYTGEVKVPASRSMHDFMHLMEEWHRWLATSGEGRPLGKAVTGISNTAFLVLGLSGLYLWWPRKWRLKNLKHSLGFPRGLKGKARDWNWHNAIGFWCLPAIIVMSATGMVISYKSVGDLAFKIFGETPPARRGPPGGAPGAQAGQGSGSGQGQGQGDGQRKGQAQGEGRRDGQGGPRKAATTAVALSPARTTVEEMFANWATVTYQPGTKIIATVSTGTEWPRTATTQIQLDPEGHVLDRTEFSNQTPGRQLRTWLRFLHTGEALGFWGQLVAGLACLGGVVLVWTGFALSWRRFFKRSQPAPAKA